MNAEHMQSTSRLRRAPALASRVEKSLTTTRTKPPNKGPRRRLGRRVLHRVAAPIEMIVALAGVCLIWQLVIWIFGVEPYVLPPVDDVFRNLWSGLVSVPAHQGVTSRQGLILPLLQTLQSVLYGFVVGSVGAVLLALLMSMSKVVDRSLLSIVTAFQSIPKVALAPIVIIWFGFGLQSRVALAALLVFFPVLVNFRAGLYGVSEGLLMMARTFNGGRLGVMLKVRVPAALPSLFTGLELGVVYALLGTIVAEFTAGSSGLGTRMMVLQGINSTAGVYAILIVFAVLGAVLNACVRALRTKLVWWAPER